MSQVQWDESKLTELERALTQRAGRSGGRAPGDTPEERKRLRHMIDVELAKYSFRNNTRYDFGGWRYHTSLHSNIRRTLSSENRTYGGRTVKLEKVPFEAIKGLYDAAVKARTEVDGIIAAAIGKVHSRALAAGINGKQGISLLYGIISDEEASLAKGIRALRTVTGTEVSIRIPFPYSHVRGAINVTITNRSSTVVIHEEGSIYSMASFSELVQEVESIEAISKSVRRVIKSLRLNRKGGNDER